MFGYLRHGEGASLHSQEPGFQASHGELKVVDFPSRGLSRPISN